MNYASEQAKVAVDEAMRTVEEGRVPPIVVVAQRGDDWGGTLVCRRAEAAEGLWDEVGGWLAHRGAESAWVVADAFVGYDPSVRPRDDPDASSAIVTTLLNRYGDVQQIMSPHSVADDGSVRWGERWAAIAQGGPMVEIVLAGILGALEPVSDDAMRDRGHKVAVPEPVLCLCEWCGNPDAELYEGGENVCPTCQMRWDAGYR